MVYGKVFESVQSDRKLERTITAQRESTLTISRAPTPVQEDQVAVPLLPPLDVEHDPLTRRVTVVVRLSLVVNIILLLVKGFVFLSTQSKAVLASLSDRCVLNLSMTVAVMHLQVCPHARHPQRGRHPLSADHLLGRPRSKQRTSPLPHRCVCCVCPAQPHVWSTTACVEHHHACGHRACTLGDPGCGAVLRDHVAGIRRRHRVCCTGTHEWLWMLYNVWQHTAYVCMGCTTPQLHMCAWNAPPHNHPLPGALGGFSRSC